MPLHQPNYFSFIKVTVQKSGDPELHEPKKVLPHVIKTNLSVFNSYKLASLAA